MKKILSILLAVLFVSSFSLVSFAALPGNNPVNGASKEVSKTIKGTEVEAYLCTDVAKEVLTIVNDERARAGVPAIKWDDKLNSAAQTRALEQYVSASHTRPDGSHFSTVNSLVNNENVAGGTDPVIFTASGVMDGWLNSQGHRETLLNPVYISTSVACVYTDKGIFWAQVFSRTSVDGTVTNPVKQGTTTTPKNTSGTKPSSTTTVSNKQGISVATQNSATKIKSSDGTVASKSASVLTAADIKNYSGKSFTIYADTTVQKTMQGRLYLVPKSLAGRQTDYKLGVYTNNSGITSVESNFAKIAKNKIKVAEIEERDLSVSTHVAVKVDLTGFNTDNLKFYTYNTTDNKYYTITKPQYSTDKSGYLHFYTAKGGYIIISDGSLGK